MSTSVSSGALSAKNGLALASIVIGGSIDLAKGYSHKANARQTGRDERRHGSTRRPSTARRRFPGGPSCRASSSRISCYPSVIASSTEPTGQPIPLGRPEPRLEDLD